MASVTLDIPNMTKGTEVLLDGLGEFPNGETSDLTDEMALAVYVAQRGVFRNGNGVTFNDIPDEFMYHEPVSVVEEEPLAELTLAEDSVTPEPVDPFALAIANQTGSTEQLTADPVEPANLTDPANLDLGTGTNDTGTWGDN